MYDLVSQFFKRKLSEYLYVKTRENIQYTFLHRWYFLVKDFCEENISLRLM